MKKSILLYCLILLCSCLNAMAQSVVFSATASSNTIGEQDQVQVTFSIQNVEDLQSISQPSFKDFKLLAGPYQSQSSNITFNGRQSVQSVTISLTYVLQPTRTGTFTIPPVTALDGNRRSYQSNPLTIKVVAGSVAPRQQARRQQGFDPFADDPFGDDPFSDDPFAAMQQQHARMMQLLQQMQQSGTPQDQQQLPEVSEAELKKNIFIRVMVDKTKVKVGEQITATYKLYARIPMHANLSKLPSLNGFWTQDFELPENQKPVLEKIDGVEYQSFTLKKSALFPQQTGNLQLDPAEAKGVARIARRTSNPFNPYVYQDVQINLKSTPVTITVTPLPEHNRPDSFSGAVGNFTIKTSLDKNELTTDDVANLKLTISGNGNLKLIEAPRLSLPNGLDAFDPQIIDTITSRTTTIAGNKLITYPIAPKIPGDYVIPSISFSYFNPQSNSYQLLHTEPFKIHVTPGKNYKKESARNKPLADIHNIRTQPLNSLSTVHAPFFFTGFYWAIYLIATALLIAFLIWKRNEEALAGNTVLLKNKRANKVALKRLKTAQKLLTHQQSKLFYEEISKAIWLYLSDKLNIPLSELSKETAAKGLNDRDIPGTLQQKVYNIIDDCELALYAPSGGRQQMDDTYSETVSLISELEEKFRS